MRCNRVWILNECRKRIWNRNTWPRKSRRKWFCWVARHEKHRSSQDITNWRLLVSGWQRRWTRKSERRHGPVVIRRWRMGRGKRKFIFNKPNMTRSINFFSFQILTKMSTLIKWVTKKNTWRRFRFKFVGSIRFKPRKTQATKNTVYCSWGCDWMIVGKEKKNWELELEDD